MITWLFFIIFLERSGNMSKKASSASFSEHINKHIKKQNQQSSNLTCQYCGKQREEFMFVIGASITADWCMHEGTGKVSCPDCYEIAQKEATDRINRKVKVKA
jgi:hypothetical protein